MGDAAPLLAAGDDASYMNKVFLLTHPEEEQNKKKDDGQNKKQKTE